LFPDPVSDPEPATNAGGLLGPAFVSISNARPPDAFNTTAPLFAADWPNLLGILGIDAANQRATLPLAFGPRIPYGDPKSIDEPRQAAAPLGDVSQVSVQAAIDGQSDVPAVRLPGDPDSVPRYDGSRAVASQQIAPQLAASAPAVDSGSATNGKALDPVYARSYAQAQAAIESDSELRTALLMAENAGDKTFKDRLATIITDLDRDPESALEAIRQEAFANQLRAATRGSGADIVANHATRIAFNRLQSLNPGLGVWQALDAGFRAAVDLSEEQRQLLYMIAQQPGSVREKLDRMADAGLFDSALASSLFGIAGLAYRGALLGPADRPDAIPSVSPKRQTAPEPVAGQPFEKSVVRRGPVANSAMEPPEPSVGRARIEEFRARIGVPTRHTVAVARTNVPGLEDMKIEGASPLVWDEAGLPRATPGPIKSPSSRPLDQAHAEEDIANRFVRAVEERGLKASDLDGSTLAIRVSNPRGVCAACRMGLNSDGPPGVLKQLSDRYPGLSIKIRVETQGRLAGNRPSVFTIKGVRYISPSEP
jgi:hypothetical protein